MKLHGTMQINTQGHLEIGGCDTVELVKEWQTPLYVMDETLIRQRCREYVTAFRKYYDQAEVIYASKVFSTKAMCKLVEQEEMGLDVVSGGELYTAMSAGFPAERIYFHGNNKTPKELAEALAASIGHFIVDNDYEMETLQGLAAEAGKKVAILLRLSPGIDAHTHDYIKTGMLDSKFGFVISNGQALAAVRKALSCPNLELKGYHCHIGSQIFELESYVEAVVTMMEFIQQMKVETGFVASELNLGGGLGIYYTNEDQPRPVESFVRRVCEAVTQQAEKLDLPLPKILVEPGRSIVGEAGTTLYTIGSSKNIPEVRKYVAVDGGMTDNPRPALYQAKYEAALANKMKEAQSETVSVAGKCCESGDMLIWDLALPKVEAGDILAVSSTGAYNYSMASHYNRNTKPAVVFVRDGKSKLVVRRESYEDLVRNDVMPEDFSK